MGLVLQVTPLPGASLAGLGIAVVALFGLATLQAAAETAVASVRRVRVQQLVEEGAGGARSLQRLMENSAGFVATSRLIRTAAVIGADTMLVAVLAESLALALGSLPWAYVLLTLVTVVLALVLVQQVGNAIGIRAAERIALGLAGPLQIVVSLVSPLVKLLNGIGAWLYGPPRPSGAGVRNGGAVPGGVTEAEIMLQVDVAEEEGVLEEDEGEMIRSIFEFGDTLAREIMVPRVDIKAVAEEATIGESVDLAIATGHSRIPIYKETIDDITGIFYVKDALRLLRDGQVGVRVREVMREAHFVPETKKVDDLLGEMQARRVHVAVVVDEYGGTAGLLTIEDILEEIVGEIQDEFDAEEAPLQQISEHEVVVDALMTLDDVNDVLVIHLEADEVDTLGGYVYAKLGRVPQQGDEITGDGARLVVEEVEGNRVTKVRIIKLSDAAPPPESPESQVPSPESGPVNPGLRTGDSGLRA
ncbi:MAG TPA: hemolysin family protein [Chloroflexota bacterium]|nr:hemolysin family protein [Chloroflexota bacterium]